MALLVYADSILSARSLAKLGEYDIDANHEFFAIGAANVGAGLLGGFPANGSQSRSFISRAAGAHSQLANLLAAALIVLTLLLLTPFFAGLPQAALAGVLVVTAAGLINVSELRRIRKLDRVDFWLASVTVVLVVALGVLWGVVVAVALSLLRAALAPYRAPSAVLARVGGTNRYRDLNEIANPQLVPGLIVYRFDAPLYFANADQFAADVMRLVREADPPAQEVLLSAEAIVSVDSTAHETLHELIDDLHEMGVRFTVARVKEKLRDTLKRSGLAAEVDAFYLEVDTGVDAFLQRITPPPAAAESTEGGGPDGRG